MANQILAGAVFQAGQVIAGIDADTIPDTFIAPSTTSSTVANKILMWNSDYDHSVNNDGIRSGSTSHGGLLMTDAAFANPLTLSSEIPQTVAAGEGKVVSISYEGEINVYDSSTGALETTFTDTLVDHGKTQNKSSTAHSCAIGAGKIFINSPEYNSAGVGSIIVVDLLDRNVPSFLITPALGDYSRLGHNGHGRVQFIDGKVVAGTSQWSAPDIGIHIFDPDGSNYTFIPTSFVTNRIVKLGDNYVVSNHDASRVEILDTSGQVLHSKNVGSYGFGYDLGVTSTNKLVVLFFSHLGGASFDQFIHIYDEGFTNEIIISRDDQPSTSGGTTPEDAWWGRAEPSNSNGFEIFGADILVSAVKASSDTVNQSGAVYRYNDSGVLQDIFYGTVADQKIGTNISVGTTTTTTALPTFIAPPAPSYTPFSGNILYLDAADSNSYSGSGNTWTDLSSEGNDATFMSSVVYDSNDGGGSFVFDGTGTKAVVNSSQLGGISATDHTIICWVNPNHIGEGDVIGTDGTSFGDVLLMLYIHAGGSSVPGIRGHVWSSSGDRNTINSSALIENGNWYMITQRVTWGGNIDLFQNETITASQSLLGDAPTAYATSNKLIIGGRAESGGPSFDGNIGIVSIYNRALTDSEISEEYNANVSRFS